MQLKQQTKMRKLLLVFMMLTICLTYTSCDKEKQEQTIYEFKWEWPEEIPHSELPSGYPINPNAKYYYAGTEAEAGILVHYMGPCSHAENWGYFENGQWIDRWMVSYIPC